jgi:hypothetical protein
MAVAVAVAVVVAVAVARVVTMAKEVAVLLW